MDCYIQCYVSYTDIYKTKTERNFQLLHCDSFSTKLSLFKHCSWSEWRQPECKCIRFKPNPHSSWWLLDRNMFLLGLSNSKIPNLLLWAYVTRQWMLRNLFHTSGSGDLILFIVICVLRPLNNIGYADFYVSLTPPLTNFLMQFEAASVSSLVKKHT